MVAGVMEFVNNNWKVINLPINFDTRPLVFHQVISSNDATPVVSQIRSVSNAQFELRISEEENNDQQHAREYVAWMAFETSTQNPDFKLEVGNIKVGDILSSWSFKNGFDTTPALFLSHQTLTEDNPFTLQQDALLANGFKAKLQEEVSQDTEVTHLNEEVGYLALDKTTTLREIKGAPIGEIGTTGIDENWATINEQVSYMVIEGSIPLKSSEFCDNGTDSLAIGKDFVAIDNCDNNVSIDYTEDVTFIGAEKRTLRKWEAIDECGNATIYTQEINCEGVSLQLKAVLQGAMLRNNGDRLMRDDLRQKKLLPVQEPYSEMPFFNHIGGGGEQMDTTLLLSDGANGIVDWVFVELRNSNNKEEVVATLSGLLQCDGDVVSAKGDTVLQFLNVPIGDYFVALRHRNHLGLLTMNPYTFSTNKVPFVDFTYNFTPVDGFNASVEIDNLESMWSGDLNGDGQVIYQGPRNDIFFMFFHVLQDEGNKEYLPNYISRGYTNDDFNMDGSVIYQGPNNDRANLLFNTILKHPNNPAKLSNFIIVIDGGN